MPETSHDVQTRRKDADASRPTLHPSEALASFLHWSRSLEQSVASILACSESLLRSPDRSGNLEAARQIRQDADYLIAALGGLRDLARLEIGTIAPKPAECSPREIVTDVAYAIQDRARAKGLQIEIEHEATTPAQFRSDPVRLRQILSAMAENALALTEVGLLRLVTRQLRQGQPAPPLQFEVVDTGMGLSERQVAAIFDPLAEVHASLGRRLGGTGLALAVAQRLAGLLGGDLTVESTLGRGTRFLLTVPPLAAGS